MAQPVETKISANDIVEVIHVLTGFNPDQSKRWELLYQTNAITKIIETVELLTADLIDWLSDSKNIYDYECGKTIAIKQMTERLMEQANQKLKEGDGE